MKCNVSITVISKPYLSSLHVFCFVSRCQTLTIGVKTCYTILDRLRTPYSTMQIDECILWLSIIFITILCTPQPTIVRWSSTSPVSDEITLKWKGFCAIIANAYFMRGMAWSVAVTLFHFLALHFLHCFRIQLL